MDADLLIVKTALECAQSRNTVVIGDDTDLLVLLCYHNNFQSPFSVYLKSEPKIDSNKFRIGTSNALKKKKELTYVEIC